MNRGLLGAGLAGFVLFLLLAIPAPLIYQWSRDDLGAGVHAFGLEGSLWRGRAASVTAGGLHFEDVEWRMRPASLLVLRLSHHVLARTGAGELQAVVSKNLFGSTLRISTLSGNLPIEQAGPAIGLPLLPFNGRLLVNLDRLDLLQGKPTRAQGTVGAEALSFTFSSPPAPLGNFYVLLETRDDTIHASITSEGGTVEARGAGSSAEEGYQLDLQVRPRATAPANVVSLLQSLGQPDAEGWRRIQRKGNF